jgi:hypothetical protein
MRPVYTLVIIGLVASAIALPVQYMVCMLWDQTGSVMLTRIVFVERSKPATMSLSITTLTRIAKVIARSRCGHPFGASTTSKNITKYIPMDEICLSLDKT